MWNPKRNLLCSQCTMSSPNVTQAKLLACVVPSSMMIITIKGTRFPKPVLCIMAPRRRPLVIFIRYNWITNWLIAH
ncbi:hypothetical protein K491DRAFT_113864 [Lophiostoma macrostomum CBS 122681]|uniref:Uncharacterized protein n=1 Tax=Lophiostoma macrostomum CBS 122681 TaxID=1314788 RepID=A0A6A6SV28_9PLEO|nr:hypothetical protein K491DRAFT_113864 [Lophiostoma macrostomum CBS 122681]